MKNIFVFVVCGAKEHIDTLHFALPYLQKHSMNEIWIVTDSRRNEISLLHEHIIDVETPKEFDHHQASIYLKTALHKFLPKGHNYCYLDTDIIAIHKEVDAIFAAFKAPIIFAPDHCKVNKFSPYAVHCGCSQTWEKKRERFEKASEKHDRNRKIKDPAVLEKQRKLLAHFEQLKGDFPKKVRTALRYFTAFKRFRLNASFHFNKQARTWIHTPTNTPVLYEVPVKKIEQETGFSYHKWTQKWLDEHGNDIWQDECSHLPEFIADKFAIEVADTWQHWNGGVFLFNDESHAFLDAWHHKTMQIFKDKKWRTRDQGTLIATANEFGLQKHPTLSKEWNFIADYYKKSIDFKENGYFTDDNWQTKHQVKLVHIYHHWKDESWSLWNWVVGR